MDRMAKSDKAAIRLINKLLENDVPVQWALEEFQAGDRSYPAGTFFVQPPFRIKQGISYDVIISWLVQEGKKEGVSSIEKTLDRFCVKSKSLVIPRIVLFYDSTTYDNALMHFIAFRSMGFKAALANAEELLKKESDSGSILAKSNVFVMPGGSMHLSSFASEEDAIAGIKNIQDFIWNGGGYVGVCAGATEALIGNPYPHLDLVDASYHSDWFMPADPAAGDWEWRTLIGPLYLEIEAPGHPVMFGYGQQSSCPDLGPLVPIDYFGGPSVFGIGSSVTVLARYRAPINQVPCDRVKEIWGSAAIVSSEFGSGKVVLFGPHPEWSEPCHRMYAQALYYAATKPMQPMLEAASIQNSPAGTAEDRIPAVLQTATLAMPILESCKRMCSAMVNLGAGDRSDPLGLWYDETMLTYSQALLDQMGEIACYCQDFLQDYIRLNEFKPLLGDNARALQRIVHGQRAIDQFFNYAENLPQESHKFGELNRPVVKFHDLLDVVRFIEKKIREADMPCAAEYAKIFHQYKNLKACYLANPTRENKKAVDELYLDISSFNPPGPLYKGMFTLRGTLDIMQYKIGTYLINLLNIADYARDAVSMDYYVLKNELRLVK
ncbi:MAG: BPL-N domain-containing protein [Methanotrichaceae archaeon]